MAKNPKHRDLFPGALEVMILQSLRLRPMHGYALVKHIKQVSEDMLQVEEGSLYPALQRMLKEGWLESESRTGTRGQTLRITARGLEVLARVQPAWEKAQADVRLLIGADGVAAVHRLASRLGFGKAAE